EGDHDDSLFCLTTDKDHKTSFLLDNVRDYAKRPLDSIFTSMSPAKFVTCYHIVARSKRESDHKRYKAVNSARRTEYDLPEDHPLCKSHVVVERAEEYQLAPIFTTLPSARTHPEAFSQFVRTIY